MAISRAKKESLVSGYSEQLASTEHAFLIGFKGITVEQVTELRRRIREKGGHYVVIKNRLAKRAVAGLPLEQVVGELEGPTAIAFSATDPVAIAKVLADFAKEVPVLEFKTSLVEGQPIAANQVADIAALPTRDQLIAKLLYLLQSPISRFVRVLAAAGPQRLATVLDQVAQKKG